MDGGAAFVRLRNRFLEPDPTRAPTMLSWPDATPFNWARDYFDPIALRNDRPALRLIDDQGLDRSLSFAQIGRAHV